MSLNLFSHCLSYFGIQNMYHIDMPQRYVLALIKKKTTRCHRVVEFIIPMFLNCSTCLGDTPPIIRSSKTVIAAFGFTYVCGCRQSPLIHDSCRQPQRYVKPEASITVFELLMMSGVSARNMLSN